MIKYRRKLYVAENFVGHIHFHLCDVTYASFFIFLSLIYIDFIHSGIGT